MFPKNKVDALFKLFVVVIVIIIIVVMLEVLNRPKYFEGTDIPFVPNAHLPGALVISKVRNAKAAAMKLLAENADMTFEQIVDLWPGLNAGNTSFDLYIDDPRKVKIYSFLVVPDPETSEQMLLVGVRIENPWLASGVIGIVGGNIFGPTGHAFTDTDSYVYMRVK